MSPHPLRMTLEVVVIALAVVCAWVAVTHGVGSVLFAVLTPLVIAGNVAMSMSGLRGALRTWAATVTGMWYSAT